MVLTKNSVFRFKQFQVQQDRSTMKVNSDGVLIGAWVNVDGAKSILDIGTGTGVIALMAAQKNNSAKVVGLEIDAESCAQARENFEKSPWSKNLEVVEDSIQNYGIECQQKFDHIISNPPFFSGGTLSDNQPKNVVRHTVKMAHGDLIMAIRRLLSNEGKVSIILPVIEGLRFVELVERNRFYVTRKTKMRPRASKPVERLLFEFRSSKPSSELIEEEIVMYNDGDNEYTSQYKELTKEYYL